MKFLPSLKSAKSLALVAATIATAIASSIAPSQAEQPTMIVRQSGHLQEYVYFPQANRYFGLPSHCTAVRELFSGAQTRVEGFLPLPGNMGTFLCNSELQGFTSPAFGSNAGVILLGGDPYYVKSDAFFKAMKITPMKLSEQEGKDFISRSPRFNKSFVLETRIAPPAPPAPAPLPPLRLPSIVALPPDMIATYPGRAELAVFVNSSESFPLGCPAVRNLWRGVKRIQVTADEHDRLLSFKPTRYGQTTKGGDLYCNSPDQIQGYISLAFKGTPYVGAVVVNGKTFMVNSPEFFGAMSIKPIVLDEKQVRDFLNNSKFGFTSLIKS
jgi:hypothetical protein